VAILREVRYEAYIPRNIAEVNGTNKAKTGKAVPLQAWTGPESSTRLRLPDF
jgi:hypothetical protein